MATYRDEKAAQPERVVGAETLPQYTVKDGSKGDTASRSGQSMSITRRIALTAVGAYAIITTVGFVKDALPSRAPTFLTSWRGHGHHRCPHAIASQRLAEGFFSNVLLGAKSMVGKTVPQSWQSDVDGGMGSSAVHEKFFEKLFLAQPSADGAREALKELTKSQHIAGDERDYETAIDLLKEWGTLLGAKVPEKPKDVVFDAGSSDSIHYMTGTRDDWKSASVHPLGDPRVWVDTYTVWLNTPVSSSLTLAKADDKANPYFKAALKEDILEKDPTSAEGPPTFHGYSKTGKASGPVIYAGLCTIDDFKQLEEHNISVKGAITLCRYGGPFRGLKVRMSAERGAVGTLIYSDPLEDGKITEANGYAAYPDGPARHPSAVQRGSVQALSIYPGDAGTPGAPSYRNATRLDPDTADALPKIPSFPISYKDAKPFLEALVGKGVSAKELGSDKWQGAVPGIKEYWTGPSTDHVEMDNQMTDIAKPRDIWNTYAVIPGVIEDEVVVLSNHRDAWTFGAADPSSGTAVVHEVVKGLGALVKTGWRPLRTILIASWDAEEYGLIGSTEAAEDYAKFFEDKAAIFINTDVAVSGGKPRVTCSPSLAHLLMQTASEIADPAKNGTGISFKFPGPLGSGSDYTAYLQHLGIASLDMGLVQGEGDAIYQYHSNYDSFFWQDTFGDPGFKRHLAAAQWVGLVTLRSSQGLFLPLNVSAYSSALNGYYEKVQKIAPKTLKTEPLEEAIKGVQHATMAFDKERAHVQREIDALLGGKTSLPRTPTRKLRKLFGKIRMLNRRAKLFETGFLAQDGKGLKGRDFYKHLGVAPGRYLGYGSTTFPGLTESITLDDSKDTHEELERLVTVLHQVRKNVAGPQRKHGHRRH